MLSQGHLWIDISRDRVRDSGEQRGDSSELISGPHLPFNGGRCPGRLIKTHQQKAMHGAKPTIRREVIRFNMPLLR